MGRQLKYHYRHMCPAQERGRLIGIEYIFVERLDEPLVCDQCGAVSELLPDDRQSEESKRRES
jgi:hypothetical protein